MPNPLISNLKIVKKIPSWERQLEKDLWGDLGRPYRRWGVSWPDPGSHGCASKPEVRRQVRNRSHWLGIWQERQGHHRRSNERVWEPRREIGSPNLASWNPLKKLADRGIWYEKQRCRGRESRSRILYKVVSLEGVMKMKADCFQFTNNNKTFS